MRSQSQGTSQALRMVDIEDVAPIYHHDGREQIRRLVTRAKHGYSAFSFHVVHFDGNLEKDMEEGDLEIVLFCIQGSATMRSAGGEIQMRPGVAFLVPPHTPYRHVTGPQGMTVVVAVSPPIE